MIVTITGSEFDDAALVVDELLMHKIIPTKIISCGTAGIDKIAETITNYYDLPYLRIESSWKTYGNIARIIRNNEIIKLSDVIIIIRSENDKRHWSLKTMAKCNEKDIKIIERVI